MTNIHTVPRPVVPMKKITLTFAALCASCALTFAGPERLPDKEVMPAPIQPSSCFDGWYFGIQGGGLLQANDSDAFAEVLIVGPQGGNTFSDLESDNEGDDESGWLAGLHIGRNFQHGGWVFGAEIDVNVTDFNIHSGEADAFVDPPGQSQLEAFVHANTHLDWYSTTRVRFGHTLGQRIYAFGTGGLAVGLTDVDADINIEVNRGQGTGLVSVPFSERDRDVKVGWTAGGGFDICVSEHWILNFTYLYIDLGDSNHTAIFDATSPNGNDTFAATANFNSDFKFHVFQGGLTFKF